MKLIKNKMMFIGIAAAFLLSVGFLVTNVSINDGKYNSLPDVSSKIVGSESDMAYRLPITSLEQLTQSADLIITGKVETDGVTKQVKMNVEEDASSKAFAEKYEKKYPEKKFITSYSVAATQIKVDNVIFGDKNLKGITLLQNGKAGNDLLETKVKNGDKVFLILKKTEGDNTYTSIAIEDGIFTIDAKNKLLSLSKNELVAKYDGIDVGVLERDIKNVKK